jgi:hypothetical protein
MVYVSRYFESQAEAEEFVRGYKVQYHPAGYGTLLTVVHTPASPAGPWHVTGTRGSSAD